MDERDARIDESNEGDGRERAQGTWQQRYGAAIMAIVTMLILAPVVAFQMNG